MSSAVDQADCGSDHKDFSVGPKVERFYLAYRNAEDNIHEVMESVSELEHHTPVTSLGEPPDVVSEIIADCQKKTAQIIRAPYTDNVRVVITTIRKKLVSKVSLDADSSGQHGQRHLNSLLELLGTWSNMIDRIRSSHWGISVTVFRLAVSQLHERVVEMALECFLKFREDKQLDGWHVRVMEASSKEGIGAGNFSIIALDFLLSQMSAMREIVQQYYKFVEKTFLSIVIEADCISAAFSPTANMGNINGDRSGEAVVDIEAAVESCMDRMIQASEKNKWRELDAVYIALEFGYLSNAIKEALAEPGLLEVEKGVFVPQAVEDVFFLLQRVVERALATGNEASAFSVGNYIIEILDSNQESKIYNLLSLRRTYRGCIANMQINVESKGRQENSTHRSSGKAAPLSGGRNGTAHCENQSTSSLSHSSSTSLISGMKVAASFSGVNHWLMALADPSLTSTSDTTDGHTTSDGMSVSTSTPANSTGSNAKNLPGTLESLLLSALDLDPTQDENRIDENTPLGLRDVGVHLTTLALAPSAMKILSQLFCPPTDPGLDPESLSGTTKEGSGNNGGNDRSNNDNGNNDDGNGGGGGSSSGCVMKNRAIKKSPLNLIAEELSRCSCQYALLFRTEAYALASGIFTRHISGVLRSTMSKPYDISGDTMGKRVGSFELLHVLKEIMPCTAVTDIALDNSGKQTNSGATASSTTSSEIRPKGEENNAVDQSTAAAADSRNVIISSVFESEQEISAKKMKRLQVLLKDRMSTMARTEVLLQLASLLNSALLDCVVKTTFSEWGALLLHREVLAVVRTFDDACDESYFKTSAGAVRNKSTNVNGVPILSSAKDAFSPLLWALKILTLDQPGDIRKYIVPVSVTATVIDSQNDGSDSGLLTESKIRKIMGRRTDFPKDAVLNVKIVIK